MKRYPYVLCILVVTAAACAQAEQSPVGGTDEASLAGDSPAARFGVPDEMAGVADSFQPAALSQGNVTVVVELSGDPITVAQGKSGSKLSGSQKQAIRASLQTAQSA